MEKEHLNTVVLPRGERSAMLQIFRGKVCNVVDLRGEGLQGGRSAIQHRDCAW